MNLVSEQFYLIANDVIQISNYSLVIVIATINIIKTFNPHEHQYKTHGLGHLDLTTLWGAKSHRVNITGL